MASVSAIRSCSFQETIIKPIQGAYNALADKIREVIKRCFGFLLRVLVFQTGELHRPGAKIVKDIFDQVTCEKKREPIDPARLAQSVETFKELCGSDIELTIIPMDGKARLNALHLKKDAFWETIRAKGGECREIEILQKREVILGTNGRLQQFGYPVETISIENRLCKAAILPEGHKIQKDLLKKIQAAKCRKGEITLPVKKEVIIGNEELFGLLKKFFFPIQEAIVDGVNQQVAILPSKPNLDEGRNPVVVDFHSPGRVYAMERRFAGIHISRMDVLLFSYRGSECEGTPSEGGYYLDGKAVVAYLLSEGYAPKDIFLIGYCGGAATAAAAVEEFNPVGVHFVAENPFHSLEAALEKFPWPFNHFAIMSIDKLKTADPETSALVQEDGFNVVEKLQRLNYSETGGHIIVYDSEKDPMMPKDSAKQILRAARKTQRCVHMHRKFNGSGNPHMKRPTEGLDTLDSYMRIFSFGNSEAV